MGGPGSGDRKRMEKDIMKINMDLYDVKTNNVLNDGSITDKEKVSLLMPLRAKHIKTDIEQHNVNEYPQLDANSIDKLKKILEKLT